MAQSQRVQRRGVRRKVNKLLSVRPRSLSGTGIGLKSGHDIREELAENAAKVDAFMLGELRGDRPAALYEASRHLIEAGGKRLRPYMTVKACEAVGGDPADAVPYAAD